MSYLTTSAKFDFLGVGPRKRARGRALVVFYSNHFFSKVANTGVSFFVITKFIYFIYLFKFSETSNWGLGDKKKYVIYKN